MACTAPPDSRTVVVFATVVPLEYMSETTPALLPDGVRRSRPLVAGRDTSACSTTAVAFDGTPALPATTMRFAPVVTVPFSTFVGASGVYVDPVALVPYQPATSSATVALPAETFTWALPLVSPTVVVPEIGCALAKFWMAGLAVLPNGATLT